MALHITISDARSRLGAAEIRDYDSGSLIGTLSANAEGSEVEGSVPVAAGTELFRINLTEKAGGAVLAQVGALTARADKVAVFSHIYSWQPNRGNDHQGQPCVIEIGEPYGDPRNAAGKKTSGLGEGQGTDGCMGIRDFDNDTGNPTVALARYSLLDKEIVREEVTPPLAGAAPDAVTAIGAALTAARAPYQGGQLITQAFTVPPFSRGKVHWPVRLRGECTAIIAFPYEGREVTRITWEARLSGRLNDAWGAGVGKDDPANEVVAEVGINWGPDDEKNHSCGAPFAVGNVWALRALALSPPQASPISGITQPVTFEFWGDKVWPDGNPGRLVSTGTAEVTGDEAWTTPPPPWGTGGGFEGGRVTFEGNGTCIVDLQKGYKWRVTQGRPMTDGYGPGESPLNPFQVPRQGVVEVVCPLVTLLCLEVTTVSQATPPQPVECDVELVQVGFPARTETTTLQDGKQMCQFHVVSPGDYTIRAKAKTGGQVWTEEPITVAIGMKVIRTPAVQQGE